MRRTATLAAALLLACTRASHQRAPDAPVPRIDPAPVVSSPVRVPPPEERIERLAPPAVAYAHGWMALASTGADRFVREHPTYDGRGVLIAILDTGVDPGVPGLRRSSTGEPKLLDLRDFSGEGSVRLSRISPRGDTVQIAGRTLAGFSRIVALNTAGPYYGGALMERSLGSPPASDLDGDGQSSDTLAVVVTRATDGWVLLADTDGDGSLAGERPVHDYVLGREFFGWAARGQSPAVNLAANFSERAGEPALDLVFALDAHGTHVAGIAGAHDLYGVSGFDGVAPGAQLLGLKISNGANGSVSTSGAILAAMDHAIRYASARRMPLVMNLSFGVGNEGEGEARIDQLVDSVLAAHPELILTVSAGNDGPGLSTISFPGSARRAISVGASVPSVFLPPDRDGTATDIVADFSARGGEVAKPDILAPGVAYSSVPLWNAGDEVKQGTSMAAPHAAGLAALLLSSLAQDGRSADARSVRQALMVTARPRPHGGYLDEGRGLADVAAAYRWLSSGGRAQNIEVNIAGRRTTAGWVMARSRDSVSGIQRFELRRPAGVPPASYTLRSDVPWLTGPSTVTLSDRVTVVALRYAGERLPAPGAHTGVVSGWPADTLAGPAFRLVATVVMPADLADTTVKVWQDLPVQPGEAARAYFAADSNRPFDVRVSASPGQRGAVYLHEPGGAPFREGGGRPLGLGGPGDFRVDARDVVQGEYQVAASAAPGGRLSLSGAVLPAPVTITTRRTGDTATAELRNVTAQPVVLGVELRLRGAQRRDSVHAQGAAPQRIPFEIPGWATGVEVDVAMDPVQWGRFTDFGVTVLDSAGRQVAQDPLQYAFGRLSTVLPQGHSDIRADLVLFPGFADSTDGRPWTLTATFRLYADSAISVPPSTTTAGQLCLAAGRAAEVHFRLPPSPWPMPRGFSPLGVVLIRDRGQVWTREGGFAHRAGP